jgi:hypothetical protein
MYRYTEDGRSIATRSTWLALLVLLAVGGCVSIPASPDADVLAGIYRETGFEFLHWNEGLAIMIWHDFVGTSAVISTDERELTPDNALYSVRGYAESRQGRRFDWEVRTRDGETAEFWIDGKRYDLADGSLFLVTGGTYGTEVTQLARDLSGVRPVYESCVAFAEEDRDVRRLFEDSHASDEGSEIPIPPSNAPPPTWETYTNRHYGFSLRTPPGYETPPVDFSEPRGFIGDRIAFSVTRQDTYWLDCLFEDPGDCPVIDYVTLTRTGTPARTAIRLRGYVGAIGGNIPQQYVTYLVRDGGMTYTLTLYALERDTDVERVDEIWPLDEADIETFERMMATLAFQVGPAG